MLICVIPIVDNVTDSEKGENEVTHLVTVTPTQNLTHSLTHPGPASGCLTLVFSISWMDIDDSKMPFSLHFNALIV